jgi:hypothetical protein
LASRGMTGDRDWLQNAGVQLAVPFTASEFMFIVIDSHFISRR